MDLECGSDLLRPVQTNTHPNVCCCRRCCKGGLVINEQWWSRSRALANHTVSLSGSLPPSNLRLSFTTRVDFDVAGFCVKDVAKVIFQITPVHTMIQLCDLSMAEPIKRSTTYQKEAYRILSVITLSRHNSRTRQRNRVLSVVPLPCV